MSADEKDRVVLFHECFTAAIEALEESMAAIDKILADEEEFFSRLEKESSESENEDPTG